MQQWIRAAAAMLALTLVSAGQPPADKCRIEGTVLNSVTGQPVRKARLTLVPAKGGEPIQGTTDAQGHYALANVPSGTYLLSAAHDGYLTQRYGAKKPGEERKGEPLELTPGPVRSATDLRLTPMGSIFGTVRDEDGDPVRDVDVALLAYGYGPTGKTLQTRGDVQTDALGEFRLFDLTPGTYYLRAKPASDQSPDTGQGSEAYAAVYYPNSPLQGSAAAIELAAGQDLRGVDFALHPVAVSFIRGRLIKPLSGEKCAASLEAGADDPQVNSFGGAFETIRLVTSNSGGDSPIEDADFSAGKPVDKDGNFEFRNVPVGSHSLSGSCMVGKQRYSTRMAIQLESAGLENLELRPVGPSTITGQLRIEGESKSKLSSTRVWVAQPGIDVLFFGGDSDSAPASGKPAEDGTFSFHDLGPDVYRINVKPPKDLYVKSITEEGRDVQESGVDLRAGAMSASVQVVLSADGGSIEGSVENGAGAKVTLIPSDPQAARTMASTVIADSNGHFTFPLVAPARYKLFAWEDVDANVALYDAEFRKPYEAKGQTVDVAGKQKSSVQLELIPRPEK